MNEQASGAGGDTVDENNAAPASGYAAPQPTSGATPAGAVRVEGLAETLHHLRNEIDLISHASKFDWVNKRLIVLRNAVIAFSVIAGFVVITSLCYHEAYRQTLNISIFDTPERLSEHGITGPVVAKTLFDKLVERRKTVTTLDPGDLKEGWTEHRSDVAIPDTHFTVKSVFRYLRELTGNEIVVSGELLVDGDDLTIKARVAGNPPLQVAGKVAEWDTMLGQVANYIYETTQPAVLASYLGLTAKTEEDLARLSQHIVKMINITPRLPRNVMAVAYDAYGGALMRQEKLAQALAAFNQAMYYDPRLGLAVMNAAEVNFRLENIETAKKLYEEASQMQIGDAAKRAALRRRVSVALNRDDCVSGAVAVADARSYARYDEQWEEWMQARFMVECDYSEEKGVAIARKIALLHPDAATPWIYLSLLLLKRPDEKYLSEAAVAAQRAINQSTEPMGILNYFARINLAYVAARLGEHERAMRLIEDARGTIKADRKDLKSTLGQVLYYHGDYKAVEDLLRPITTGRSNGRPEEYLYMGMALGMQKKFEEARQVFQRAQLMFPLNCKLHDEAGKLMVAAGHLSEGITEFEKGIAAVRKCGLPYVSEARALLAVNRSAEARARLESLIQVAPDSDGAAEARAILATLAMPH